MFDFNPFDMDMDGNVDGLRDGSSSGEGAADGTGRRVGDTVGWALGGGVELGISTQSVGVDVTAGSAPQPDANGSRQMISRAM